MNSAEDDRDSDEDPIDQLVEYEEEVLNAAEHIDASLSFNLKESQIDIRSQQVLKGVGEALAANIDDLDVRLDIGGEIMNYIADDSNNIQKFKNAELSGEMISFLIQLRMEYHEVASIPTYIDSQGRNYWTDLNTDLVIRDPYDIIGLNHELEVGHARLLNLSVNLDGNLNLIRELLSEQNRAVSEFGDTAVEQITRDIIDDIDEELSELEDKFEDTEAE